MYSLKGLFGLSLNSLSRAKWFVFSTVILLAVVMTITTLIISINKKIYFDQLPYSNPDEIYSIYTTMDSGNGEVSGNSKGLVFEWSNKEKYGYTFALEKTSKVKVDFGSYQEKLSVSYIYGDYLNIFNAKNVRGDLFNSSDLGAVLNNVIVRQSFIDKNNIDINNHPFINIEGTTYEIVGVIDSSFINPSKLMGSEVELLAPMTFNNSSKNSFSGLDSSLNFYIKTSNINELLKEFNEISYQALIESNNLPLIEQKLLKVEGQLFADKVLEKSKNVSTLVMMSVLVLSLMLLSIVINNIISRYMSRKGVYSMHLVLGASFKSIYSWIVLEVVIVSAIAVAVSLFLSNYFIDILKSLLSSEIPRINEISINFEFAIIQLLIVILVVLALIILVKKQVVNKTLIKAIGSGAKGVLNDRSRLKGVILTIQMTVSVVCLCASIHILIVSQKEINAASTYDPGDLYFMQIGIPETSVMSDSKKVIGSSLKNELLNTESAKEVELIDNLPLSKGLGLFEIFDTEGNQLTLSQVNGIGDDFLEMFNISLRNGRNFETNEIDSTQNLMIVNRAFELNMMQGNALGKYLQFENRLYQVIGVVDDIVNPFVKVPGSEYQLYVPYRHYDYVPVMSFVLDPKELELQKVKNAINLINPELSLEEWFKVSSLHESLFNAYNIRLLISIISLVLIVFFMIEGLRNITRLTIESLRYELVTRIIFGAKKADVKGFIYKNLLSFYVVGILMAIISVLALNTYKVFGEYNPLAIMIYLIVSIVISTVVLMTITERNINKYLDWKTLIRR